MSWLQRVLRAAPRRPDPEPLELDDTRVVAVGTLLWVVALLGLLVADVLGADVHGWWLAMCLCGAVLGVCGLRYVALRKRAIAREAR